VTQKDIPNLLTLFRICLVPPIMWLLYQQHYTTALWLLALGGITDALDGFLAKRFGWVTRLGEFLDPAADKLLLFGAYLVLGLQGLLPAWLVMLVIGRDVVIILGFLAYQRVVGLVDAAPSLASKFNTLVQIILGLLVIANQALFSMPKDLMSTMVVVVTLTTLASGTEYVWTWGHKAATHSHDQGDGAAK
jgi:cardiolipin synthase